MKKIAIVHDWFVALAGAEKVMEQVLGMYPDADIFAVYADPVTVSKTDYLKNRKLQTTFIQNLPRANKHYRCYLPLMPLAIEQLDLSAYDLIISSSHAVSKGVLTGPDQLHISYVHSPIRYAWDLQHQYLKESGLDTGLKGWFAKWILHKMRLWDYRTAAGVDHFVANSRFIARRIRKVYGRSSDVIYPPVNVNAFELGENKQDYYFTASRLVPYKHMDLIVQAFSMMPDKRLVVMGEGPDMPKLKAAATSNITLLGYQPFAELKQHMQQAKAFLFAAEEDFGITLVEAQACGTPVIAYGKGGALESICGLDDANPTGVFFYAHTLQAIMDAVSLFERHRHKMTPVACRNNALRFSTDRFCREFSEFVVTQWNNFEANR